MDQFGFTQQELTPYIGILILVLFILITSYTKGYREFWSPLTIVAIIYGYYCCLGPYQAVSSGDTYDRLINMRQYYTSSFWGAFISLISIVAGFKLNTKKGIAIPYLRMVSNENLFYYGKRTVVIGLILFTIATGGNILGLINPLDADSIEQTGGSFSNYFLLSINFLIPGISLLFIYYLLTKKHFLWFVITFGVTVGLFITLGFRYRIVLLVMSVGIIYYLTLKKRPNLIFGAAFIAGFITLMGIINITRNYGSGLNLQKLEGKDTEQYYNSGLRESLIFQTSGAVIDLVPEKYEHVGLAPIWSTLLFPIPQRIYQEKNSASYIVGILETIYGPEHFQGSAFMAYAEHYLAFGWTGIIVAGFLLGWFYKKLWVWFLANSPNPLVKVAYAVTVVYLYVILSRGYLPQVTMLFFFSAFPIYFIIWRIKQRYRYQMTPRTLTRGI